MEYGDPSEGYGGTNMLPHIGQHNVVHNGKIGVNKAVSVVENDHVHTQGIPELRLGRDLLYDSLVHHVEDKVNVSDSPLRCHSGTLKKVLRPMTSSYQIPVIIWRYLCNILGSTGRRVTSVPYNSMRKQRALEDSIWIGNSGSLRRC